MPDQRPSPKFQVGDTVRVKHGVADVDYPDIPMGGWVGTISAAGHDSMRVRWSIETLEHVHPVYRRRCERDGIDIREYWVNADDLEPAPIEPLDMEQPTTIVTRPLSMDDQDDRICMAFGLTSDDPLPCHGRAAELTYFHHLKAHLTFPFPAQFRDPIKNRPRDVTVTGMCEDFPIDDSFGVMCQVLDGGEEGQMPLSELEVQRDDANFPMVDDYLAWFVNSPEAGVEDYLDDDWNEDEDESWNDEDEDWEDEDELDDDLDDELERDYHEEPPPTRPKVGRNDPCPCGSGKKFKKCCLKKQRGDGMLDGGVGQEES